MPREVIVESDIENDSGEPSSISRNLAAGFRYDRVLIGESINLSMKQDAGHESLLHFFGHTGDRIVPPEVVSEDICRQGIWIASV